MVIQTISSASEGRSIQDLTPQSDLEWILGTAPLAVCFTCDATLPAETTKCPICDCETSIVRRCPGCRRIVSAQHTYCIYCSMSFLRRGHVASRSLILPGPRRPSRPSSDRYGGVVVEATMMVALLVLSGFFAYTYFWRYARVERSAQAATPPVAPISSAARERSARRARIVRPAPPLGDAAVSAPAVLPLPPPPPLPLRFTIVGGYEPPPLPLTHDSSDKSRGGP